MSEAPFISKAEELDTFAKGTVADLLEWGQHQPAIGRCAFCPQWVTQGTIEEIRQSALEHRREFHPELIPRKKRRPPRPNLMRWRSTLDDDQTQEIREEREKRMQLLGIRKGLPEESPLA